MGRTSKEPTIGMVPLAAACILAKMTRSKMVIAFQTGRVRGEFDASRATSAGRYMIAREDAERLGREADEQRANLVAR